VRSVAAILFGLKVLLDCFSALAAEPLPRSVLILDQSTHFGHWQHAIIGAIRSTMNESAGQPMAFYAEHLDLFLFKGQRYADSLENHFREKYRDKPIGVIVVVGAVALRHAMNLRASLWPAVPIVFCAVDEETVAEGLPANVTGITIRQTLASMIAAARIVVPDLKAFAIVGTPLDEQVYARHFIKELPNFSRDLEFIDLTGLSIAEVRQRVSSLPDKAVILYIGITSVGLTTYVAAEVVPLIAERANRPIVVDAESLFGSGAVGGFILGPDQIGQNAGRLALRVLDGEDASHIPIASETSQRPLFDWRQLQRWHIDEGRLPPGSEIRFRELSVWQRYRSEILATVAVFLLQMLLIFWLVYEHRRRSLAEAQSRRSMAELTHMNRIASAGLLSASLAHEVSQPLTGIVTRANAAMRWLKAATPNVDRAQEALKQIVEAGHRAADVVTNVRAMFKKDSQEKSVISINELIRAVVALVYIDLRRHDIETQISLDSQLPVVIANKVQLQQVILNLVMNAIEAVSSTEPRVLSIKSKATERGGVHVSIEDTGSGIDPANMDRLFKPLFTTKARGMGMGLSICQSIIESHGGKIWASPVAPRGSAFQFELPTGATATRTEHSGEPVAKDMMLH